MLAYKTVWEKHRGVFVSSTASDELEVRYRIGQWAEAPVGGLLCWGSLDAAVEFQAYLHGRFAFEAEVEDPLPLPPIRALNPDWRECAEWIWLRHCDPYGDNVRWPAGTVAFRRVKLLRRVVAV